MEEAQKEDVPAAEAAPAGEVPSIVKEAFGGSSAAKEKETPKDEPAAPSPAQPPKASREEKRVPGLVSRIKELEAELAKAKDGKTPEDIINGKMAEWELRQIEQKLMDDAQRGLMEAFPDEAERQEFMRLSEFAPYVDKYAPEIAQAIAGSDISYKLAMAFYTILDSNPKALAEFLQFPLPTQKRELAKIERYVMSGGSQQPNTAVNLANLPKPVTPSDSGGRAGKADAYKATLARLNGEA